MENQPVSQYQTLPLLQPKKTSANVGILGLDAAQTFWLLLALHGVIIAGELYMAWKAGWIKL
jgi:hypothetical protein